MKNCLKSYNFLRKDFGDGLFKITYSQFAVKRDYKARYSQKKEKRKEGTKERAESIAVSYRKVKDKVWTFAYSNDWEYFVTLTFNKLKVDRFNYNDCRKLLAKELKHYKRKYPFFEYLCVPEMHKNGAWHFHGLFKGLPKEEYSYSRHKDKAGRKIYNICLLADRLGHTTAQIVDTRGQAAGYLVKYISKDLISNDYVRGRSKYIASNGLDKSVTSYTNCHFDDVKKLTQKNDLITAKSYEVAGEKYYNVFTYWLMREPISQS